MLLAKERLLYILKRLHDQPSISVTDLCKELGVSKSTIQRDLKALEQDGKVDRARGGAIQKNFDETMSDLTEVPVLDKLGVHIKEKQAVCKEAAKMINDGDLVFLDSGTTPVQLLPYLQNKRIKVVTNSFFLLSRLSIPNGSIYMLGGAYNPKYETCYGPSTIEQIKEFRFDKVFIGANGVDLGLGEVYASEFEVGALKKAVMERGKHSYLLVDHSKFSLTGISTFGYLNQFDKIFVDDFPTDKKNYKNIVISK
ncbi:DeoR/GlpR family DNA-binding transcription regulator [Listeria ivanovii]|uniref:DeoR/GlpR family DNA-binding transcription regulator n=1 Tax=Listeria ivanovii TaxID=1638 RepID=UPI00209BCD1C|nr:DeoR/GlpR family DNA-binding transcription regulator [Listeria ivanovii]